MKEIYFTGGGEPCLHPAILTLLGEAPDVAPTTVLTNGTRISEAVADALAEAAVRTSYSLGGCQARRASGRRRSGSRDSSAGSCSARSREWLPMEASTPVRSWPGYPARGSRRAVSRSRSSRLPLSPGPRDLSRDRHVVPELLNAMDTTDRTELREHRMKTTTLSLAAGAALIAFAVVALVLATGPAAAQKAPAARPSPSAASAPPLGPLPPVSVPADNPMSPEKVALGK